MDSRLMKALSAEAAVTTAQAVTEIAPQLAALENRLARIEERLTRIEADNARTNAFFQGPAEAVECFPIATKFPIAPVRDPGAGKPKGSK